MDGLGQGLDILGRDNSVNTGGCSGICMSNNWARILV